MPLPLDLCDKSAHGESPALRIEHGVARRELALQASLGSLSFSGGSLHRWPVEEKHHAALVIFHITGYRWNCNRVLPIYWHLSLYGEMRPRFTSRCSTWISAACYELLALHFETCLVKNTSRLVTKRWFIGGWGCPFSLHWVTFDLSLQVWLQELQERRCLQQNTDFYLHISIHILWNTGLHVSLSFSYFSEIISWGISRKTNSRFFTILGEEWKQIQLQNTSYFKCKMILP